MEACGRKRTSSSEPDSDHGLRLHDGEGWEDAVPDVEEIHFLCLFCHTRYSCIRSMLRHCKTAHDFDLSHMRKKFVLDFLGLVQLVNYIRSKVQQGVASPVLDVDGVPIFKDPQYLIPAFEDDAVLYSLDDALEGEEDPEICPADELYPTDLSSTRSLQRIEQLERELNQLHQQFNDYRKTVDQTLESRWNSTKGSERSWNLSGSSDAAKDHESDYFISYSYNAIHETMLKDAVRTDAYRDFIYDNKQLLKGKTVLDVGCGTGILSMFCARAGASRVIAVDNSDIIDKARQNVLVNGLGHVVICLKGKIEEVSLPASQVDIIISEWMGYCLLYEAMLDSVLWARDHYLQSDGLMIPSHTTLHIAPLTDPDYIADHISFWQSVYGFDMTSMLAHIYDEVLVRDVTGSRIAAQSDAFLQLPLHSVTPRDLTFNMRPFSLRIIEDLDSFDGFVIWFDTFFLPSRKDFQPSSLGAKYWTREKGHIAFTTGPGGPPTHWRQGVLLINYGDDETEQISKGSVIEGNIGYKKGDENPRELDIEISWSIQGKGNARRQIWYMR